MTRINIELKAKCSNSETIREILAAHHAKFQGTDHQIDTYFYVPTGRLKLREGTIERCLIFYDRQNECGPKRSNVTLYQPGADPNLKTILTATLGVFAVVDKSREIYWIDNIKIHIDQVVGLGSFVEIEAMDMDGRFDERELERQCRKFMMLFGVKDHDLVACSYSDMLVAQPNLSAVGWIERLHLKKHPEGGYFGEAYRALETISKHGLPNRYSGDRVFSTAIYYLLSGGEFSAFHRLKSDEIWHFYDGSTLELHLISPAGELRTITLGRNHENGDVLQAAVSAGYWFSASVKSQHAFSLVGCTVAPGFDYSDFELGNRQELLKLFPQHRDTILKWTRT